MACTSWNPHDAGLAHMFSSQTGSSAIGRFMGSPGMRPPGGGFFPVVGDSCFGYGYGCYPPGYAGYDAGKSFKNWVGETSKTSTWDCIKGGFNVWVNNAMCSNAPATAGSLFTMGGAACDFVGGASNGLGNFFGGLFKG